MAENGNPREREDEDAEGDTDELLQDHPEMAPDQSRISVEKVKNLDDISIRRTADTGDLSGDSDETAPGGERPVKPLRFARNADYSGNEDAYATDADYSRGSGWVGGKLWGEDDRRASSSAENTPPERAAPEGFQPSSKQLLNAESAAREAPGGETPGGAQDAPGGNAGNSGDLEDQGRDLGVRRQVSASQAFGRDIGASGLPGSAVPEEEGQGIFRKGSMGREHSDWTAALGKLGGSSPGSEENLKLAELFRKVKFPANREEVLAKLSPVAEFRIKPGMAVDVREAVGRSRISEFRHLNDLVDCVKDALRRAESLERNQPS